MRSFRKMLVLFVSLSILFGCAYRYYLGFHGPSIKLHPDVHDGITQDGECLECHGPDSNSDGPLPLILTLKGASNAITMKLSPKDSDGAINAAWHRLNGLAWSEESAWKGKHAMGHLTAHPNEHLIERII